jgi:hypothetical protein
MVMIAGSGQRLMARANPYCCNLPLGCEPGRFGNLVNNKPPSPLGFFVSVDSKCNSSHLF